MLSVVQPDRVTIGRIRARLPMSHAITARHNAERLLRYASLQPEGLPRQAILCVKQLREPASSSCWLDNGRLKLPTPWETGVRTELERHFREAARPLRGHVPAGANAVLFLDYAELLACLALDWLAGYFPLHWWWRELLKNHDGEHAVVQAWTRAPENVPAAFEILSEQQHAVEFSRTLPVAAASEILHFMRLAHGVPDYDPPRSVPANTYEHTAHAQEVQNPTVLQQAPWCRWIPEATTQALPPMNCLLLAQALMLRRAPTTVRSTEFQGQITVWLKQQFTQQSSLELRTTRDPERQVESDDVIPSTPIMQRSVEIAPAQNDFMELLPASVNVDAPEPIQITISADASVQTNDVPVFIDPEHRSTEVQPVEFQSKEVLQPETERVTEIAAPPAPAALEQGFDTEYGGIFFLLNVALALEYYGDFTSPLASVPEVGIWDFVAQMGLRFSEKNLLQKDPLWLCLAKLSSREDEFEITPSARQWLDHAEHQVRELLVNFLERTDAPEFLCRIPGHVVYTHTHIDIFYSMETHPIEIRIACLDRDPGWIPSAGRYVAFHFD